MLSGCWDNFPSLTDYLDTIVLSVNAGKSSVGRTGQNLSEDLLLYYDMVTKAILSTDCAVMKVSDM